MEKKAVEKKAVKKTAKPRKKAVKKLNPIITKAVIRRYGLKK